MEHIHPEKRWLAFTVPLQHLSEGAILQGHSKIVLLPSRKSCFDYRREVRAGAQWYHHLCPFGRTVSGYLLLMPWESFHLSWTNERQNRAILQMCPWDQCCTAQSSQALWFYQEHQRPSRLTQRLPAAWWSSALLPTAPYGTKRSFSPTLHFLYSWNAENVD